MRYILIFLVLLSCTDNQKSDPNDIQTLEQAYFSQLKVNNKLHDEISIAIQNNGMRASETNLLILSDSILAQREIASSPYRRGLDPQKFLFKTDINEINDYIQFLDDLAKNLNHSAKISPIISRASFYLEQSKDDPNYNDHLLMSLNLLEAEQVILQSIKQAIQAHS